MKQLYSLSTELENCDWCRPVWLRRSVATTHGCRAFTVTPVPMTTTHMKGKCYKVELVL